MKVIPDEYLQLEWIEATGQQYIATQIQSLSGDVIEIKGRFTRTDVGQVLFGTHGSGHYRRICCNCASNSTDMKFTATAGTWDEVDNTVWDSRGKPLCDADTEVHVFKLDHPANTCTIDNTVYTLTAPDGHGRKAPCEYVGQLERTKMPLFCNYHDDCYPGARSYFRMCYAKFYHNGALVGNFIPALRKSDGKPGMYDTVTAAFYVNQREEATEDFHYPLPSFKSYIQEDYQECEWVKSSGVQTVNVGSTTGLLSIEIDGIMNPQRGGSAPDGVHGTAGIGKNFMMGVAANDGITLRVNGGWLVSDALGYQRHNVMITTDGAKSYLYVDGVLKITSDDAFDTSGQDITFFGAYRTTVSTIYSARVYSNGTVVRELIPVYNLKEETTGLYDTISKTYYPMSAETGATHEAKEQDEDRFLHHTYKTILYDNDGNQKKISKEYEIMGG